MSKLEEIIPNADVRKVVYQVFGVAGLLIGVLQVAMAGDVPPWLDITLNVYAFLAAAGFGMSQAKTPEVQVSKPRHAAVPEGDDDVVVQEPTGL